MSTTRMTLPAEGGIAPAPVGRTHGGTAARAVRLPATDRRRRRWAGRARRMLAAAALSWAHTDAFLLAAVLHADCPDGHARVPDLDRPSVI